ncbi:MAG: AIPR family protein [Acidobacteria bacterium]|nr:AIPR family protein [Acidobacteriota bacterium]
MAKNDLVLLDALLQKKLADYPDLSDLGELFDVFAFENILKDHDLSYEEIEQGWVDGGDDGGVDAFFIFLDGLPITESPNSNDVRKRPEIEIVVITCKHEATFRQAPLNNLLASVPELFDLSRSSSSFESKYNENLLEQRELFCETFKELAARQPSLHVRFIYASRGDTTDIAENIRGRACLFESRMSELFSDCSTRFDFYGASELLQLTRKQRSSTLGLTFIENTLSRAKSNYVVLCRLSDYYKFITDEEGELRRYLFESNVRDFLGRVPVNEDISATLQAPSRIDQCDFWWLNNGVTIISTAANVAGKEINLENIQIVNGLQTTETIFEHFQCRDRDDDRAVLVKIIVTQNAEIRDRIIKATNYQTAVELPSLRATEKIQRDIEDILLEHNWFYDRRKNYHRNQGRPIQRIVSPAYLASCILALVLKDPAKASRLKIKFMRIDSQYKEIFNPCLDIRIYPVVLDIVKQVEHLLTDRRVVWGRQGGVKFPANYRWLFAYVWATRKLGESHPQNILDLATHSIDIAEIDEIWMRLCQVAEEGNFKPKRLYRNHAAIRALVG